jgi:hypothetical protein
MVSTWLAALAVVRSGSVQERDPYWQIRAGVETLRGASLTRPDSWSWAPVDAVFAQTSPAWNLALGGAWEMAGFVGFFLVSLISLGSLLFLLVALSRRLGAGPLSTLAALLAVLLLGLSFLSPRATVAAQTLFLASVAWADWWRRRADARPVLLGAAVVGSAAAFFAGVGSWLHLSWLMLAPAMAVSFAVLWAATPLLGRLRIAAFTTTGILGAGAGVLAGPYGTDAWQLSQRVQEACSGLLPDWSGMFTPGLSARWAVPGALAIVAALAALGWVGRRWPSRGEDTRVGLVAALLVLALPAAVGGITAIRFTGVSLLALAPIVSLGAAHVAARTRRRLAEEPRGVFRNGRVRFWADGRHWRPVIVALSVVLFPAVVLLALPLGRPVAGAAIAERLPQNCRLFSDPDSAAPVLLLRPDVKVWIDGRADYFGRARNLQAISLLRSAASEAPVLDGATCIILRRDGQIPVEPLVRALDEDSRWSRLDGGGSVAAWVRK